MRRTDRGAKRTPKPVTPRYLENAARGYLQRFATSSENLRRVLMRRVQRSARLHGTDPAEGARWVNALIARYEEAGLLDDAAYAEALAGSLHRRGTSARAVRLKLKQKGLSPERVDAALRGVAEAEGAADPADLERATARALARRRRLGPWRRDDRAARRERDLAALARAGFSFAVAREVIDGEADDGG